MGYQSVPRYVLYIILLQVLVRGRLIVVTDPSVIAVEGLPSRIPSWRETRTQLNIMYPFVPVVTVVCFKPKVNSKAKTALFRSKNIIEIVKNITLKFLRINLLFSAIGQNSLDENAVLYDDDGYGTEWMYFPDGDGVPRRISLEMPLIPRIRGFFSDEIEYRLYTRNNKSNYILLDQLGKPLSKIGFPIEEKLSSTPIKLITHGWESSAESSSVVNIKEAYLKTSDVVVIEIDWSSISKNLFYPIVAYQTQTVGSLVGKFLDALNDHYNVKGDQLHLIGHSLGAHVMGNAGHHTKVKVGRITGLDPARPLFEFPNRDISVKLDTNDAEFVDVIHTCGGVLGVENTIGHADFFPNRGFAPQPGCLDIRRMMEACSHSRAHFYFAESILYPTAFPAYQCRNWTEYLQKKCSQQITYMGESVDRSATGNFYLETNQDLPFGRGVKL